MDFNLTEEHLMIRDAARDFAQTELLFEIRNTLLQPSAISSHVWGVTDCWGG